MSGVTALKRESEVRVESVFKKNNKKNSISPKKILGNFVNLS